MAYDTLTVATAAAIIAAGSWLITLYNARKAVHWKRAELASAYLKDLTANPVLVFACRALEWNGGRLVVPEPLRPLLFEKSDYIQHSPEVLKRAMVPGLTLEEMDAEPRLQLYRTSMDDLLSWLDLIASGLNRKLFKPEDLPKVGYWVEQIRKVGYLDEFIRKFGYSDSIEILRRAFASFCEDHRDGRALTIERGGFGSSAKGRSAGG
ncbi:hypothetical protein [Methylobacterium sp. Leaf88]|uniref:hypothetical protein n=1 Tax=Methylobacterium sp. Leaf88 TaxID=1736244 RepID=UPI0012E8576C|nr:hypothetical protein [Methylobacterium sp. Leaf88]